MTSKSVFDQIEEVTKELCNLKEYLLELEESHNREYSEHKVPHGYFDEEISTMVSTFITSIKSVKNICKEKTI